MFDVDKGQDEIYDFVSPLISSALDGYNIAIVTYGQTGEKTSLEHYTLNMTLQEIFKTILGSGKTHTINGIVEKAIDSIFLGLNNEESVEISMFELYNGKIFDLFDNSKQKNITTGSEIENLTKVGAFSKQKCTALWSTGIKQRKTAPTAGNAHSSRSHAVTRLYYTRGKDNQGTQFSSSLSFIDLAGSENADSSTNMEETKFINSSLSALGTVVVNLRKKLPIIDFKQNVLTQILKPSLTGDSKTLLFTNISTSLKNLDASLNSLRFATKMSDIMSK